MSLKIYVYAICKNEIKFVSQWFKSMSEADGIYVLDTGSDDGSACALKDLGAKVSTEIINPWRFDTARNRSLDLVPTDADICVCTDLDELFVPGWRKKLETHWKPGVERASYRYTWNFLPDGREGTVFMADKIHSRHGWKWINPVHEVLARTESGPFITASINEMQLNHYADYTKSREQYLPLLELAVAERPDDDRNMHYLGREYMYRGMWEKSAKTLQQHLSLPTAKWKDERCASMRYIARCMTALGRDEDAMLWLIRAVAECPESRDPWVEAAQTALLQNKYELSLYFISHALKIQHRDINYISSPDCWNEKPWDIAAVASFYLGKYTDALYFGHKALEFAPNDDRLKSNIEFYKQKCPE